MLSAGDIAPLALRAARAVDLVASLVLFGSLVVVLLLPGALVVACWNSRRWFRALLFAKLAAYAALLPLQALEMSGGAALDIATIRLVATDTVFGTGLLLRLALAVAAIVLAWRAARRRQIWLAVVLSGASLVLQIRLGHVAAIEDRWLAFLLGAHVLAAGAWLGALPALIHALRHQPGPAAYRLVQRFSHLASIAVAVIVATAWFLAERLVGDVGGWFGTDYGRLALAKLAGLFVLLALAAANKVLLTRRLADGDGRPLVISIVIETAVGLVVVAIAAWLATTPPGIHLQPVWPFALQPDFSALDDSYARRELWRALALLAVLGTMLAALLWRRTRWTGLAAGVLLLIWLPQPNLRLLAKPAAPTSFHVSETRFTAASIVRGEEILRRYCTPLCFRPKDDPSLLGSYNIWGRQDGDLFAWLVDVFDRIGHSPFPHGTIARLSDRDRWLLIDYFRARVAGDLARRDDSWRFAIPAPELDLTCGGRSETLAGLRGRVVLVQSASSLEQVTEPKLAQGQAPARVLLLREEPEGPLPDGVCISTSPDGWSAFAILAGRPVDGFAGTDVLIDAGGWLRLRLFPDKPRDVAADIAAVAAKPFDGSLRPVHRH